METTDWDTYGTGRYEKCADCMAHCGYEPTAADQAISNPLTALWTAIRGIRTKGPMAPEISLVAQRPAEFVFSSPRPENVERDPRHAETGCKKPAVEAAPSEPAE